MSSVFIILLILVTILTISNTFLIYVAYKDSIKRITLVTRVLGEFIADSQEQPELFHGESPPEKTVKKVFISKRSFNNRGTR